MSKLCLFSKQTTGNMAHSKCADMSIFVKTEAYLKQDNYHFSCHYVFKWLHKLCVGSAFYGGTFYSTIYIGTESKLRISLKMSNCLAKKPLGISANLVLGKKIS